ncbi:sugar-binding domain-containing protein [Plantactinospora sp. KBS50]|uniref:sugar-binding domain-containing protein n=1 Tax=Plantactinospora sp. KBS50 TaxID=2024580 RepID=UPI000BAB05D9|nr:sugar-binding domain-containing protein [Plantactinospora sp. KBS50]ASW55283.1 hypothetical protein CIK06_15560 [Plantactinospora sp. KBS50]
MDGVPVTVLGPWECRPAGTDGWRPVPVPGSWEQAGIPLEHPGPVEYRCTVDVPATARDRRLRLRFGAVSYACVVLVNGREAGRHVGMWDPFEVEITGLVEPGRPAELLVRVEKPASLTGGPDSAPVPGRYPQRETLAGFLPYVWGHSHGGVWQPVRLLVTGDCALGDVAVTGRAGPAVGRLSVAATLLGPGEVTVEVRDPAGQPVARRRATGADRVEFELDIPRPRPWSPRDPARYAVTLRTGDGDERTVHTGLRTLTADGALLRLNGDPVYPRMALSWGWYPDRLHPDPGPDRVRADLTELRRLGFNGVKLCLWFPPEYYFALADELGMLLWVELPMWLPHPTAHFRRQLFGEAERLVRAAANHPSVILVTLGCELSAAVGADVLGPLYDLVKRLAPGTLVRDNSGSGEAYGGLLDEFADFDDHHLYCEPAYFRATLDHFAPRWRAPRPWLFGEFCDLDTFRDLRRLDGTAAGAGPAGTPAAGAAAGRPWWTSADPAVNPQGARWQYDVPAQEETLRGNGFWDRGAELERISARQAVLHRKVTLEAVRSRADTSGYVITGERDTPISTAGLWDDLGRLKVDPDGFAAFNGDLVVALDWDRRRAWTAGGDRPAPWDTWCYPAGARVRPHLVLAHHGPAGGRVDLRWRVGFADTGDGSEPGTEAATGCAPFASGRLSAQAAPGTVSGLGVAEFTAPVVDRPRRAVLRIELECAGRTAGNSWSFWFLPDQGWADTGPVALVDPAGRLTGLAALAPGSSTRPTRPTLPPAARPMMPTRRPTPPGPARCCWRRPGPSRYAGTCAPVATRFCWSTRPARTRRCRCRRCRSGARRSG